MDNFFYYTGVIFIAESIRCMFNAKKEIDSYKSSIELPNKNLSSNDLNNLKATLTESLKGKIIPSILGALMITWNIIGIFYTPEWKLFLTGIGIMIVSSVVIGYNKKFRTVPVVIMTNIISVIIISLVLYSHFA